MGRLQTNGNPVSARSSFPGKSKYSLTKMFSLATDAVTSFSFAPLRLATVVGLGILVVALVALITSLAVPLVSGRPGSSAPLIPLAILFVGGAQLLSIGILGEYIGRIYMEVKRRPFFVVRERYGLAHRRADVPALEKDVSAKP